MFHRVILPVIAALLALFAISYALYVQRPDPNPPPPVPPPTTPFGNTVAGAGMVEPSTEASGTGNIAIGSQLAGVVERVHVRIGQEVKVGELLLELDRRQALADLRYREAALAAAQAQMRKLEQLPRPEEVPASEAAVKAATAELSIVQDLAERNAKLFPRGAVTEQDYRQNLLTVEAVRQRLAQAQANLALLKAGAWEPDRAIAYTAVEQARAQVQQAQTILERLQIRAPVAGTILQVNVRPGEAVANTPGAALILMGNLIPYHVRVNVDEEDVPRLRLKAPAIARLRGDALQQPIPLQFVRLEPYIVPKVSLTGISGERVDTRVVQLIYALDPEHRLVRERKVLVGQLVDVFIDTSPVSTLSQSQ